MQANEIRYLRFFDGTRVAVRNCPSSEFVLHPVFLRYYVICIAVWSVLSFRPGIPNGVVWPHLAMTVCVGAMFFVTALAVGSFLDFLFSSGRIKTLFTPAFAIPLLLLNEALVYWLFVAIDLQATLTLEQVFLVVLQSVVALFLFEFIFAHSTILKHPAYVDMAELTPETCCAQTGPGGPGELTLSDDPDLDETTGPDAFNFAGASIPFSDLRVVQAEDHYVRIVAEGETKVVRGRFSDALKAVPEDLGIQLNRSAWVSRSHIQYAERGADYNLRIVLNDETAMPVARSRKSDVTKTIKGWELPLNTKR